MPMVPANGVRLNVSLLGKSGAPVVFLHGLVMDNLSSWYFTVASRVATERRVILFDLRGHGRSEAAPNGYDIDNLVRDLDALFDALEVDQPVALVGNSFGGLLAVAYAAAHPERVERLALIDAHTSEPDWGATMAATLGLTGSEADAKIAASFQSWLGRHSERKRTRLAQAAHRLVHGTTLLSDLRSSPSLDATALAPIACPVMAIYGEHSDALASGRRLVACIPQSSLRLLTGCTHSVLWEATARVRSDLVEFLCTGTRTTSSDSTADAQSNPRRARSARSRRFLFVVPPLTGHVNPTVAVADQLASRGHTVAWVGHRKAIGHLLPAHEQLIALDETMPEALALGLCEQAATVRGPERLKFLWESFFIPLAKAMVPGVEAAVEEFGPDVMVVDQQALAGSVVARKRNLPWATSATTSAGLVDPLRDLPRVRRWLDALVANVYSEAGVEPEHDVELSPHLVLGFTSGALVGQRGFAEHVHLVGPALCARPFAGDFPRDALGTAGPRVFVSLGTVNAHLGQRFYGEMLEAVTGTGIQTILVAPDNLISATPDNVRVFPHVPQLQVLAHMDAVVSHGGHNTVIESLSHGLPLLLAPIKDDQPVVAQQVVDAGAGIRVSFARASARTLKENLFRLLHEPHFRRSAEVVRDSLIAAGGATRAAELLERLS